MPIDFTELLCQECGSPFKRPTAELRYQQRVGENPPRFCSQPCLWQSRKTKIELTCDVCGSQFLRHQSEARKAALRGHTLTCCSKACAVIAQRKGDARSFVCEACSKPFTRQPGELRSAASIGANSGRFCSAKCRDTTLGVARRNQIEVVCATCGKSFMRIPANVKERNFCSYRCMGPAATDWSRENQKRSKCGKRADIGHFVRSSWEANVARLLKALAIPYEYESRTFWLPDGTSYRPDFHVAGMLWIEVKGQLMPDAAAKIAAFREAYPDETLIVIGLDDYRAIEHAVSLSIPGWEHQWPNWGKHRHPEAFAAKT